MSDLKKAIDNVQKIIGKSITNVSGDIYNIGDIGNFIIKTENKTLEKNITIWYFIRKLLVGDHISNSIYIYIYHLKQY